MNTPLLLVVSGFEKLDLYLKDVESAEVTSARFALFMLCSSFLNYHKRPERSG